MVTPSDSEASNGQITKLSDDELAAISGGLVNVSFTLMMAEDSSEFAVQDLADGGHSGLAVAGHKQRSLFALQFSGTFKSMDHFSSFFSKLTKGSGIK